MRKLVIANRGAGGIGKSASIKAVYALLKEKGFQAVLEEWQYQEDSDIKAIFDIKGVKVGIESQGDPECDMERTMEEFVKDGCGIIVTACRTKSTTFKAVKEFLGEKNQYDILWLAHYVYQAPRADLIRDSFNKAYAEHVLQLIEDRINNKY